MPRSSWPAAADPAAAERLMERIAAHPEGATLLAACPGGVAMLRAIGGGSPFLSDLAVREYRTLEAFTRHGPDAALAAVMDTLTGMAASAPRAQVAATLRRAKRQAALIIGLADIGGAWGLARVTAGLSALAEACLRLAVDHLLLLAHTAGQLQLPDPARPAWRCGLTVLGMGKLGARELNYSSDIDLILLFDPEAHTPETLNDTLGATFTRMARGLVTLLEARDADGYVFRTDLRLRPDPAATPPAMSLPAAIAYYESLGQNWERAAMTKARPVAGDIRLGDAFLAAIRPFVWRRRLDFAAIADLHGMKRRIDEHRGFTPHDGLAGFDIKLGPGGIREIEFAAQTLQLVWGGRNPALRDRTTLGALRGLVRAGHLSRRAAAELTAAYRCFRRVEHRLQMVQDRQTHILPSKPDDLRRFAVFLGCRGGGELAAMLTAHLDRVRSRYAGIFETVPDPSGPPPLDLAGPDLPAATVGRLGAMGFHNAAGMIATLRGWQAGRLRALRTPRARELMESVLPALLAALAAQADPDAAFNRFDAMLARQPAGVALLSMVQRNPALLHRIAAVLGAAPSLADHLAQTPSALEGLLTPARAAAVPCHEMLSNRLRDARALEDVAAITGSTIRGEEFRLCVAQLQGAVDADGAGVARTALADAALQALLPAVLEDHARRYGRVRGGDMAVVALGKAGSREMMAGSDLDLLLLYVVPPAVSESDGPRRLPVSQYFIRAAHAFVAALTAPGAEGPLYHVDTRLRPSGNKGPVAVPLPGFVRYHASEAWTWERMALTRGRVVAGRPAIRARAARALAAAVLTEADPAITLADAAAMRARLARELPASGPWDVKLRSGGGMEVEFIAQALQLAHRVQPVRPATADAFRHLATAGALTAGEGDALVRADLLWRTVQSVLRITVGRATGSLPPAATEVLLRAVQAVTGRTLDLTGLHATMDDEAAAVRSIFTNRIGPIL